MGTVTSGSYGNALPLGLFPFAYATRGMMEVTLHALLLFLLFWMLKPPFLQAGIGPAGGSRDCNGQARPSSWDAYASFAIPKGQEEVCFARLLSVLCGFPNCRLRRKV
jgi:hypothetical protein